METAGEAVLATCDSVVAALAGEWWLDCCSTFTTAAVGWARSSTGLTDELDVTDGADDVDGDEVEWDRLSRPAIAADDAGRPLVTVALMAALTDGLLTGLDVDSTEAEMDVGTKAEKADTCSGWSEGEAAAFMGEEDEVTETEGCAEREALLLLG